MDAITDCKESVDERDVSVEEQIDSLQGQLESMMAQRLDKMDNAKSHMFERLTVMSDQWKTANGLLNALKAMREIDESLDLTAEIQMAKSVASGMSMYIKDFANEVSAMSLRDFCEECGEVLETHRMYDKKFVGGKDVPSLFEFASELLRLGFCSSIGPDLDDCAGFYRTSQDEIDKIKEKIEELSGDDSIKGKIGSAKHKADKE